MGGCLSGWATSAMMGWSSQARLFHLISAVHRDVDFPLQLHLFRDELRNRGRVLKRLGHITSDGVVQLKGRAACQIDTADELLVTELMFNGVFIKLDAHQIAAVASCFMQMEKSNRQVTIVTAFSLFFRSCPSALADRAKPDIGVNSPAKPYLR
jgi:superfamily II RNA helicase